MLSDSWSNCPEFRREHFIPRYHPTTTSDIHPSDVYDVASLLVSDLAYLHPHLPQARPPNPAYDPGRIFPSHVFQRAGILLKQLQHLESAVHKNPQWLTQRVSPS